MAAAAGAYVGFREVPDEMIPSIIVPHDTSRCLPELRKFHYHQEFDKEYLGSFVDMEREDLEVADPAELPANNYSSIGGSRSERVECMVEIVHRIWKGKRDERGDPVFPAEFLDAEGKLDIIKTLDGMGLSKLIVTMHLQVADAHVAEWLTRPTSMAEFNIEWHKHLMDPIFESMCRQHKDKKIAARRAIKLLLKKTYDQ